MPKLPIPIHPGEVILEDFMKPLGLTQYRLAHDIGVSPIRIRQIVNGQRAITVDTALRLARNFGLEVGESELGDQIQREVKVLDHAG
jgi:addiction module HigA family antidote